MRNFVQPGQVITVIAVGAVVAGRAYDINGVVGVATGSLSADDIAAGRDEFEMALGGVYSFPKGDMTYAFGTAALYDSAAGTLLLAGGVALGSMIAASGDDIHVLVNNKGEASGY